MATGLNKQKKNSSYYIEIIIDAAWLYTNLFKKQNKTKTKTTETSLNAEANGDFCQTS